MKRYAIATTLAVLAMLTLGGAVSAGRAWCRADPIVALDGHEVQIWVAMPEEYQPWMPPRYHSS